MEFDHNLYDELIALLFASVVDESQLQYFAERLSASAPEPMGVALRRIDFGEKSERIVGGAGFEASFLESFHAYYASRNVFHETLKHLPLNTVGVARELLDIPYTERSEFYADWYRPQGFGLSSAVISVARDPRHMLALSVEVPDASEPMMADRLPRLLVRLGPHLSRLAALSESNRRRVAAVTLDTMPTGAMLIGHDGRVLHANASAERLMAETSLFVDRNGMLRGSTPYAEGVVGTLLAEVARGGRISSTARLADFGQMGAIYLSAAHLPESVASSSLWRLSGRDEPAAIVYIATDHDEAKVVVPRLMAAFGLDEMEALLAFGLYASMPLEQTARLAGLSPFAARLMIERVMQKMDARRYSDVIRRVSKFTASI